MLAAGHTSLTLSVSTLNWAVALSGEPCLKGYRTDNCSIVLLSFLSRDFAWMHNPQLAPSTNLYSLSGTPVRLADLVPAFRAWIGTLAELDCDVRDVQPGLVNLLHYQVVPPSPSSGYHGIPLSLLLLSCGSRKGQLQCTLLVSSGGKHRRK